MRHVARAIAKQGRGPDTELVHMTKGEVKVLAGMVGLRSLPKNPKTGLPEAGLLSTILPMAAMFIPGLQGVGAYMLAGAAGGALGSAIEGGNILRGGLMGGLTGAMGGWGSGASMGAELAPSALPAGAEAAQQAAIQQSAVQQAAQGATVPGVAQQVAAQPTFMDQLRSTSLPTLPTTPAPVDMSSQVLKYQAAGHTPSNAAVLAQRDIIAASPTLSSQALDFAATNPKTTALGIGALGYGLNQAMQPNTVGTPKTAHYMAGPSTSATTPTGATGVPGGPEATYFTPNTLSSYTSAPGTTRYYADGGVVRSSDLFNTALMPEHQRQGIAAFARGGALNLRPRPKTMNPMFMRGAGDGMSDSISAQIDGQGQRPNEPIRVTDGEYIVPADAVSHIGNGSSNAGAKKLDGMVSKVRKARTGKMEQAPAIKAERYVPA